MKIQHKDMSFHQLMNGTLSKILTEARKDEMSMELSNKLSFLQFVVEMSFKYDHKDVLAIVFETVMAWQNRQLEWDQPWPEVAEHLKGIRGRFIQSHQPHTVGHPRNNPGPSKADRSGGAGNSGSGKSTFKDVPINGVPTSFMKEKNICIRFNSEKSSHKNKYGPNTLQHICAGCFAKDNSKDHHRVFDCKKHNHSSLFH